MKQLLRIFLAFLILSGTAFAGGTIQWPTACWFDSNGDPLSGGKLYSYIPGTTTNKSLYSDRECTTAHTNPEILDSNGCTEVYGIGKYKLVLKDSADATTYFTDDNVTISPQSASYYYPNYNAADQGATGNSDTIKYAVDTLSTDSGTIVLLHNSGSATTTYTLSTSETIPANARLIIEKGALIADDASNATLTINSDFNIGLYQVFDWGNGSGDVLFGDGARTAFPEWWGAVPDGSTDCLAAFDDAIASLPNGGIVELQETGANYYNISEFIKLADGIIFQGKGYATHIYNSSTTGAAGAGNSRIFDFGNHTATSILAETYYILNAITQGDKTVTTTTAAHAGNFSVGDLVFIKSDADDGSNPTNLEINQITSVNATTGVLGIRYGAHVSISAGQRIAKTNGAQTDPFGYARRIVKQCGVKNLRMSNVDGRDWWHAAGGSFEGTFENLWIETRAVALLNATAHSTFTNIRSNFDRRALELAVGCHDNVFDNINARWETVGETLTSEKLVAFGQGAHDNVIKNFRINAGEHNGTDGIKFSTGNDNIIRDGKIIAPSLANGNSIFFGASAGECKRNKAINIVVFADNGNSLKFDYGATVTSYENEARQNRFFGTPTASALAVTDGTGNRIIENFFENGVWNVSTTDDTIKCNRFLEYDIEPIEAKVNATTITATVADTDITGASKSITGSQLRVGDRFKVRVRGIANGTTDNKTIRVVFGDTAAYTTAQDVVFTAAAGEFWIDVDVIVALTGASGSIRAHSVVISDAGSPASIADARTVDSINLTTQDFGIEVRAWLSGGTDDIYIDQVTIEQARFIP